ncbi:hypothetical protein A2W24_06915 [Microgenomates group bacterium RBG_16_45_19]|nr:MAG: hypothetical protein A2W24_06915 [Microgenomates group bacterium RBG_16_45_19]
MKAVVDTNVWVRFFVRDNEAQYRQAVEWFKTGRLGKRKLVLSAVVVAETCYVLDTFYHKTREEIASVWEVVLGQRWLAVAERSVLIAMWPGYRNGWHWVDSYLWAWSGANEGDILSFDKKLRHKVGTKKND